MMASRDIRRCVFENARLVEDAYEILTRMDEAVWNEIKKLMSALYKRQEYFDCFEIDKKNQSFSFGRAAWGCDEGKACFYFDVEGLDQNNERMWLGILGEKYPGVKGGLFFYYDWEGRGIAFEDWKKFLGDFVAENPSLEENGIRLNADRTALVTYVKLDFDCLAENPGNPVRCLASFERAFGVICSERATFGNLVKEADAKFAAK